MIYAKIAMAIWQNWRFGQFHRSRIEVFKIVKVLLLTQESQSDFLSAEKTNKIRTKVL